jgi:ectoine hydroxylase-related dioxygenase (phytanoyl-CoA dioxygenase family)
LIDLKDFKQTGYTVIKNWISESEIQQFINDYETQEQSSNENYKIKCASHSLLKSFKSRILEICDAVNLVKGGNIDLIMPSDPSNIYAESALGWGWHQEHEPQYMLQNLNNYINLWVLLLKEDSDLSGLSIIPTNKILELVPERYHGLLFDEAAKTYTPDGDVTHVRDSENVITMDIPLNINTIAVTPTVSPGDLLLLDGKTIHRTQDSHKKRLAVSIRCIDGSTQLSYNKYFTGDEEKVEVMEYNKKVYDTIKQSFNGKETATVREIFKGGI